MSQLKAHLFLLVRLALVCLAMTLAYTLSTTLVQPQQAPLSLEQVAAAFPSLLLVSSLNALALAYPLLRSPWHGWKLVGALFLLQFGVETFMTQIETWYFNAAMKLENVELASLVLAGAVRAVIFAPLAVLLLGRWQRSAQPGVALPKVTVLQWGLRVAAVVVLYPLVYFAFGYYVAWQWEETRLFYTGSREILPVLVHFRGLFSADPVFIPFQLLRGLLWAGLAMLVTRVMHARRWEAAMGTSLVFVTLMISGLVVFSNPYFPPKVAESHTYEIASSMLLFGIVAGWTLNQAIGTRRAAGGAIIDNPTENEDFMPDAILQVRNFRKVYGSHVAVEDLSFEVMPGEIFGLLGPNGAGKTSTLECLEGLRQPDGGWLRVAGIDPAREAGKLRDVIGVQLQSAGLPESFTVEEAMRFFCAYHNLAPRSDLLERLGLQDKLKTQFYELSAGLQRRLVLALAVAHQPRVLFLDEPTAGLDVASRVELHTLMRELKEQGTTIILATHDMAEAEELSDRVAILLQGRLVTIGTPLQITAAGAGLTKVSVRTQNGCLSTAELNLPGVSQQIFKEDYHIYFSSDIGPTLAAIIALIERGGDTLIDLRVERPSLEDRFLEITHPGVAK